jgi:hypothetical protein
MLCEIQSLLARKDDLTNVMGFMKGILTSTASATKFSISRSIGKLYLALTYSGFAAYKQATRPPRGVIPTRSPIPRTAKVVMRPCINSLGWGRTSIDMRCTSFKSSISVCNSYENKSLRPFSSSKKHCRHTHAGVVVKMQLNITSDNPP